jgi:hypothetical protein
MDEAEYATGSPSWWTAASKPERPELKARLGVSSMDKAFFRLAREPFGRVLKLAICGLRRQGIKHIVRDRWTIYTPRAPGHLDDSFGFAISTVSGARSPSVPPRGEPEAPSTAARQHRRIADAWTPSLLPACREFHSEAEMDERSGKAAYPHPVILGDDR